MQQFAKVFRAYTDLYGYCWCCRAKVEEIALLNTIFVRWDGIKIWYPNVKLSSEAVMNVARSNNRWEGFKVGSGQPAP